MKPIAEMTNDEFFSYVVDHQLEGWIPLKTYQRLFPEETKIAIDARIKRKHWQRSVHFIVPEGANTWVNLTAIREWVKAGGGG